MTADPLAQLGNYRVLRLLGEGGFAKVYLGEHIYLKTPAALKVPKMRLAQDDLEDFLTEARTSVNLQHPHIVRVLECGVESGVIPYLVMSYAPGGTLRSRYSKGSRLPFEVILLYVKQVASALQYIHDRGLIHQDIKPENMLLGTNGEVMLSDFGIAAVVHRTMTQSIQEVTGTARYMAPEQFRGKARPASDQYALGIVVYEWLCGDYPFHGSFPELYSQHLFIPPPPLHEKVAGIPPAVEQVVMKALAKEVQERFPRVEDFAIALQQAGSWQEATSSIPPMFVDEGELPTLPSTRDRTGTKPPVPTFQGAPPLGSDQASPYIPSGGMQAGQFQSQGSAVSGQNFVNTSANTVQQTDPTQQNARTDRRNAPTQPPNLPLSPHVGLPAADQSAMGAQRNPVERLSNLGPLQGPPWEAGPGQAPPQTAFRPPDTVRQEPAAPAKSRRGLSSKSIVMLIGLALVVVIGGVALLSSPLLKGITATRTPTPGQGTGTGSGSPVQSGPPPAYSPMFGYNLEHTRYNPAEAVLNSTNVSKLVPKWMAPTVSSIYSSPVVANGIVYISSTDHNLYAYDVTTGKLLWKAMTTSIDGRPSFIFSTLAVVNGTLYIGSTDHNLYAFNATGCGSQVCLPRWAAPTGDSIYSSPAVANGVVYIGSDDHNLYAFNAATGALIWKTATGDMIVSSPAVANGVVYVGSFDHKFYAINATTGAILWMATTDYKINSSPTVSNGVVYIGSDDHNLYAFNASGCGKLMCSYLWVGPTESYIYSSPAVANGLVYIGSHDGVLYAFKAAGCGSASCSPAWTSRTGGPIESSPAVANGVVYVGSQDHKLYALDAMTGAILWSYSTADQITSSSPIVMNGMVYVGSLDHKLYAFSLPGA